MGQRSHVPFDVFAMQVDVPVSTMVRDGDLGWTCGQCPLSRDAEVLSRGDLVAQASHVGDMIETVLQRGGFEPTSIGKLHVYFAEAEPGQGDRALADLVARFPHTPVVVPIRVPHFYYDGMMIEVDVFTGSSVTYRPSIETADIQMQITDAEDLVWVSVTAPTGTNCADPILSIEAALEANDLKTSNLLSDHWLAPLGIAEITGPFIANPNATVLTEAQSLTGSLMFARSPVQTTSHSDEPTRTVRRRAEDMLWISGIHADPQDDLVAQTRAIMSALDRALTEEGMSFDNVTKLTAHYVGGASPEELHGNMTIRHSYYSNPGPASTGLPVSALLDPRCKISIDVVAVA